MCTPVEKGLDLSEDFSSNASGLDEETPVLLSFLLYSHGPGFCDSNTLSISVQAGGCQVLLGTLECAKILVICIGVVD